MIENKKPKIGETYYDYDSTQHVWNASPSDLDRYEYGNCFPNLEISHEAFARVKEALLGLHKELIKNKQ